MKTLTTELLELLEEIEAEPRKAPIPTHVMAHQKDSLVYCLRFNDGTLYVGYTTNPLQRYKTHTGFWGEEFVFKIIFVGTPHRVKSVEKIFIRRLGARHTLRNVLIPQKPSEPFISLASVAKDAGVKPNTLYTRMRNGETLEEALDNKNRNPPKHMFELNGEIYGVKQLSRMYNISYQTILYRINTRGMSIKQAIKR